MENQELEKSKISDQEINLFDLLKTINKYINRLIYKLSCFFVFSLKNIHWLVLSLLLSIGIGWWEFYKTGSIYEATTVVYSPNDEALVYIKEIENIDKFLYNKMYKHLVENTSLDTNSLANILSLKYTYGIITSGAYPTYFKEKYKTNNKENELLSINYLQLSIQTKRAFSEDSIKYILRSLLLKNNYLIESFKLFLTEKENLLLILNETIVDAKKAADIELTKKERHTNINNIVLSSTVDTTTLVRPLKLQREKIELERELEVLKNGPIVFVNDFYFSKVVNSRTEYIIHWAIFLVILTYTILFVVKRRKKIISFVKKINEETN